jgi:hypothetical protein
MQVTCPICEKHTSDVDEHVWCEHVPSCFCWCRVDLWELTFERGGVIDAVFKQHCEDRGGFLAHYLECQMGVASAEVPSM